MPENLNTDLTFKIAEPQSFKFEASDGEVEGYGAVVGNVDSHGERIVRGAFSGTITKHQSERRMPLMLWQHDRTDPIGKWTEMGEDDVGLRMAGRFNLKTSRGQDAYQHVKAGDINGLSIGYRELKSRPNGQIRELVELELVETSIVSLPANSRARITGVKAESRADIERLLREGGLPRAAAVKIAHGGWPALSIEQSHPNTFELAKRLDRARADLVSLKGLFR